MTTRDRLVAMIVAALGVLAAVWLLLVVPERHKASELNAQVSSAQQQLSSAQAEANSASAARTSYADAYASIVRLGEAVPVAAEVPSLIYEIDHAAGNKHVSFESITAGTAGAPSPSAASSATASASASFSLMPFTFVFDGSFTDLNRLLAQLDGLTTRTTSGDLRVQGRLLAIQGVNLAPVASATGKSGKLTGTISADAYVLPTGTQLTGGATPSGPAGTTAQTSTATPSASPSTPAVIAIKP
jgi:Type II secretion system (T2SS), protein M